MADGWDFSSIYRMADRYEDGEQIVRAEVKTGMTKSVMAIEADAKRGAPVDRGQLRRSLTHEVEVSGRNITGRAGTNLEYAPYVEDGRGPGKMPPVEVIEAWAGRHGAAGAGFQIARAIGQRGARPQPFLKPAYQANKGKIERELGQVTLRRIAEKLAG
jgi:HK97 gp10 family phage protein